MMRQVQIVVRDEGGIIYGKTIAVDLHFDGLQWRAFEGKKMSARHSDSLVAAILAAMPAAGESLARGEFICSKCGLRKDSEFEKGDF